MNNNALQLEWASAWIKSYHSNQVAWGARMCSKALGSLRRGIGTVPGGMFVGVACALLEGIFACENLM
jgi:hypothetical protein